MLRSFKGFFIQLSLFSMLTVVVLFLWQNYASPRFQTSLGLLIWSFFIATTALIHVVLLKSTENNPKKFITSFMVATALKLFSYLIIILVYALIKREAALGFVMLFLVMYFLYSAFEVVVLLKHFKKGN